jgi:inhibitor of cysteine peptidase
MAQDGQVIRALVRDTIVIRLPENPTTGVRWDVEPLVGSAQLTGDDYEHAPGSGIGAAATRVLTLQLSAPGAIQLNLKRWQPWEGESSVDATFSCTVQIERGDT